jgi:putative transposase
MGEQQLMMLRDPAWAIGGADLVWRQGVYYLHVTQSQEAPDLAPAPPAGGIVGVDLGILTLHGGSSPMGSQATLVATHYVRA